MISNSQMGSLNVSGGKIKDIRGRDDDQNSNDNDKDGAESNGSTESNTGSEGAKSNEEHEGAAAANHLCREWEIEGNSSVYTC